MDTFTIGLCDCTDVGVGLTYTTLNGVSFLPQHAIGLSIQGSWTVLDWGKRGSLSSERTAQERAAAIGLELARDQVSLDIERAYRSAIRAERGADCLRGFPEPDAAERAAGHQHARPRQPGRCGPGEEESGHRVCNQGPPHMLAVWLSGMPSRN